MISPRKIELLAPAKTAAIGIEAIRHGADAVYIGAPKFSARSAAGNDLSEIQELVREAHLYQAKVYVALNTILNNDELDEACALVRRLYEMGVDALIVQDMALLQMDIPPIALHASTQMDIRTPQKVRFLEDAGFSQVVLARELSLDQIREIKQQTTVPLEVFVHGALCVGYSGQCYVSQCFAGRSANRGACAQYCRLPYTLEDATGKVISRNKHLLSLKDMNRSDNIEALLDSGVTSFKIEGRLKELSYVKNITAYYRRKIDEILRRRPEYVRSSIGASEYTFTPQPDKSFSRGFTPYFINGTLDDIASFDTPKSIGEWVGTVKSVGNNSITVAGIKVLNNGDGFTYVRENGEYAGFRVNRVEDNKLFPSEMPKISAKTKLFRNYDHEFEKILNVPSAQRKIKIKIVLQPVAFGFALHVTDEQGLSVSVCETIEKEVAKTSQAENQQRQLSKWGNTPYIVEQVDIEAVKSFFIASSLLTSLRRKAADALTRARMLSYRPDVKSVSKENLTYFDKKLTYLDNVNNDLAKSFYLKCGVEQIDNAYEMEKPAGVPVMFTKHCIRRSLGICKKTSKDDFEEPFYLKGRDFKLKVEFDCKKCEMEIFPA